MSAERSYWAGIAARVATPVLAALAARKLHATMPVEEAPRAGRKAYTHLEACGRLLAGLAPWLELGEESSRQFAVQARAALDAVTDPASPDFCNFNKGSQPLVDAAFLAQGILRAPKTLWQPLDARVRSNVLAALRATRAIKPFESNWLMFSAMVETALLVLGAPDWNREPIDHGLKMLDEWYKGDGLYGDGPHFHADYYNSFVIQPMLVDVIRNTASQPDWKSYEERIWTRSRRWAAIVERFISPEGTYPIIGRSLAYRTGVMQSLGQMALLHRLPDDVTPGQARAAMTAVIHRSMEAPDTFDKDGWLTIGICGHQPGIGETYISTGSLYLCSVGLLPLGLPASDPFWSDPPAPWTSAKAWSGKPLPIDHAIAD